MPKFLLLTDDADTDDGGELDLYRLGELLLEALTLNPGVADPAICEPLHEGRLERLEVEFRWREVG
jgi:hypothetical protein